MIYIKPTLLGTLAAALAVALAPAAASAQDAAQPKLPVITLKAGMHLIAAEVASTPMQTQTGMMFRTQMGQNEGMLFVFEAAGTRCFWMRNTLLPLSIAFVADDGRIVNVAEMKPRDETSHCAKEPVRYALEMNQGWFAKRGLKAGAKLSGAPFKP